MECDDKKDNRVIHFTVVFPGASGGYKYMN